MTPFVITILIIMLGVLEVINYIFFYIRSFKFKIHHVFLVLGICFGSCQTYHPLHKYNYFVGSQLYNDSLNVSIQYFGDIDFKVLEDLNKRELRNKLKSIKSINLNDLLVYGTASSLPEYNVLLFIKNKEITGSDTTEIINLVFKDSLKKRVLYKKIKENKIAYFLLEAKSGNESLKSLINDGLTLSKALNFKNKLDDKLTYSKVFEHYKGNCNHLWVLRKLEETSIANTEKNAWMQFQYLVTINSFMSKNENYDQLIDEFESSRKKILKPILDTLINQTEFVKNSSVINKIATLSKETRVVMLNENHWYPKHRKFAINLLEPLRNAGYTHLALEALYQNEDSIINKEGFASYNSGYYLREPYFGHLIRKAKELGFEVVGYENYNDELNREHGQAQNLKSIIAENPNAKLFVYAGLDHIIEEKTKKGKRMAAYFKEITKINPITLNQTDLVSNSNYEVAMIPYKTLSGNEIIEKLDKKVDFFIINNIDLNLSDFYPNDEWREFKIKGEFLDHLRNKEFLVSVYNQEEYSLYKSKSIPIIAEIKNSISENFFNLSLPQGSYVIIISTAENDEVYFKNVKID